ERTRQTRNTRRFMQRRKLPLHASQYWWNIQNPFFQSYSWYLCCALLLSNPFRSLQVLWSPHSISAILFWLINSPTAFVCQLSTKKLFRSTSPNAAMLWYFFHRISQRRILSSVLSGCLVMRSLTSTIS